MRTPDKPGSFRIVPKAGALMLSGVRANGERVKVKGLSRDDAEAMAARLFPRPAFDGGMGTKPVTDVLDDFGLPPLRVSPTVVASAAPPNSLPSTGVGVTASPIAAVDNAIAKAKKAKQAQSLMELTGLGWAAGTVMLGRKLTERAGKDPVKPSPRQVNDLADSAKDTLTEWFGDRDIKPWQMTILLTLAIPASMLIQSPKKKPEQLAEESSTGKSRPLQSV
jgi:hypothetical protein